MKKFISIVLVFTLLFTCTISAFAEDANTITDMVVNTISSVNGLNHEETLELKKSLAPIINEMSSAKQEALLESMKTLKSDSVKDVSLESLASARIMPANSMVSRSSSSGISAFLSASTIKKLEERGVDESTWEKAKMSRVYVGKILAPITGYMFTMNKEAVEVYEALVAVGAAVSTTGAAIAYFCGFVAGPTAIAIGIGAAPYIAVQYASIKVQLLFSPIAMIYV